MQMPRRTATSSKRWLRRALSDNFSMNVVPDAESGAGKTGTAAAPAPPPPQQEIGMVF